MQEKQPPMLDPNMSKPVIIVSGLPRSGTSMMMKMLESGGLRILSDNRRKPDEDNPRGYYEYEKVKDLKKDSTCIYEMEGKVVKVISMLLYYLPPGMDYRIIFMQRNMREILDSQGRMLERLGKPRKKSDDDHLEKGFEEHLNKITDWLADQENMDCMFINYNKIFDDPLLFCARIQDFVGEGLDIKAMSGAIDPSLYRNRQE